MSIGDGFNFGVGFVLALCTFGVGFLMVGLFVGVVRWIFSL
jgi:hypothetical protein